AVRDLRFSPVLPKELPFLECTVFILTNYETADHYLDWELEKHGMIIEFTDPDYNVMRSWMKVEAIDSLMRKAGYTGRIAESLRKQIHLTRYQSTLYTMSYSEYVAYVKRTRGEAPVVAGSKSNGR
ncbi:hypothetical protein MKX01_023282, partial [Papaver californicum]